MKNVYFIENKIQCDYSEFSYVIEKKKILWQKQNSIYYTFKILSFRFNYSIK